jgi:hypothetical protein
LTRFCNILGLHFVFHVLRLIYVAGERGYRDGGEYREDDEDDDDLDKRKGPVIACRLAPFRLTTPALRATPPREGNEIDGEKVE